MKRKWMMGSFSAMLLGCSGYMVAGSKVVQGKVTLPGGAQEKVIVAAKGKALKAVPAKNTEKTKKPYNAEKDIYQWFQTYSEVIGLLEKKAFRDVDFGKFIQDSLKSAVSQIDAHSSFFTRKSYKAAIESTSGEFSGIGVSIITKATDDEALAIVDVIQGGPSEKAGLKAGDKIVEVDGAKLKGLSADEVVSKLKGRVGSVVTIKVIRHKKPLEFKVKRDIIKDQTSVCYRFKQQNVYYLALKMFNEVAAQQVEQLLDKANKGKCRGIILDLRRNPGGTLDSAIDMAGLFLQKGSLVVSTKDKQGKVMATYNTTRNPLLKSDVPIIILIDNFTASASEILAGTLRHHSQHTKEHKNLMVFLVGTPSFGKGSVQELIPIKNGCALKVTSMLYYLPNDKTIQAQGIEPDFLVKPKIVPEDEMKWINDLYGKETSLKNHISAQEAQQLGEKKKALAKEGNVSKAVNKESGKDQKTGFWQRFFGGKQEAQQEKVIPGQTSEKKEEKEKSWEEKQQEALSQDIQIQAGINLINLFDFAKRMNKDFVIDRPKALQFLKDNYLVDGPVILEKVK